ncbi:MAG TPA: DUF308 domain-containing protein [Ignavibacteria bacterium]|nr:DUF308 domain-containing protein [Ignavibacteria bacterium]
MLETLQKRWWLIAVRGVLAIVFGILALASPYIVIFSLITFFAFFAVLSGFFILTLAFLGETDNKGLRIIEGLIFLGAGIVVLLNPISALGGIMIFIAAWAILSGLIHIIGAIKMRKVIANEWLLILNGVISIIFGILLAGNLIQGAGVMLMVFGAFAILSGIFSIMLAVRIKTYRAS